jgi:hypothetical protein
MQFASASLDADYMSAFRVYWTNYLLSYSELPKNLARGKTEHHHPQPGFMTRATPAANTGRDPRSVNEYLTTTRGPLPRQRTRHSVRQSKVSQSTTVLPPAADSCGTSWSNYDCIIDGTGPVRSYVAGIDVVVCNLRRQTV